MTHLTRPDRREMYYGSIRIILWGVVNVCVTDGFFRSLYRHLFKHDQKFNEEVSKTTKPLPHVLQHMYDMRWYVIGTPSDFSSSKPEKVTVWSKEYVVWKTGTASYTALDNACPHRGASFSDGIVTKDACVMCPYHGYEYDESGTLVRVPGVDLAADRYIKAYDAGRYDVVEDGGWVYLNTFPYVLYNTTPGTMYNNLLEDCERTPEFRCNFMQLDYDANPRLLTENGLDISHIGFVHSFGNRESPNPMEEEPPKQVGPNRYKTSYLYKTGEHSMAKIVFGEDLLSVENEFVLPHMSIARVKFAEYVNTIVTFATPISNNKTRLYVKNYRNFWRNMVGDWFIQKTMWDTMNEDRRVVEGIYENHKNGKFNMRYDKLANTYRVLYEKEYRSHG
jgi:phenylpropionate dioxygenase-like ring-hydroxylating dioxygenase large terminal subunit